MIYLVSWSKFYHAEELFKIHYCGGSFRHPRSSRCRQLYQYLQNRDRSIVYFYQYTLLSRTKLPMLKQPNGYGSNPVLKLQQIMTRITFEERNESPSNLGASPVTSLPIHTHKPIFLYPAHLKLLNIITLILPRQSYFGRHYIQLLKVTTACKLGRLT